MPTIRCRESSTDKIPHLPPGERSLTMRATISPVPGVQLHVTISAALVFEQSGAPTASVWHLIAMALQSMWLGCHLHSFALRYQPTRLQLQPPIKRGKMTINNADKVSGCWIRSWGFLRRMGSARLPEVLHQLWVFVTLKYTQKYRTDISITLSLLSSTYIGNLWKPSKIT